VFRMPCHRRASALPAPMPDALEPLTKGDLMSDTPETAPGRRWYHLRPEPRRRTDLMGFSSTLWMAVGWLIVIVVIFFPFPWWGW
jgi:hypothetical protein